MSKGGGIEKAPCGAQKGFNKKLFLIPAYAPTLT
jgi:hypothetical protein